MNKNVDVPIDEITWIIDYDTQLIYNGNYDSEI